MYRFFSYIFLFTLKCDICQCIYACSYLNVHIFVYRSCEISYLLTEIYRWRICGCCVRLWLALNLLMLQRWCCDLHETHTIRAVEDGGMLQRRHAENDRRCDARAVSWPLPVIPCPATEDPLLAGWVTRRPRPSRVALASECVSVVGRDLNEPASLQLSHCVDR